MSWIGLLLVGVAVVDLLRSAWPRGVGSTPVAAAVVILLGVVAGLQQLVDVVGLVVAAGFVVAWGVLVRRGEQQGWRRPGSAAPPLVVLGGGIALGLLCAPLASPAAGWWGEWLAASPYSGLATLDPSRGLLLLGVLGVQLSTGNVVVRLILTVTDTVDPAVSETPDDPAQQIKGGRLLGPMERLVILGLGLAGELTAASVVIAAKGLLRWPELRSRPGQEWIHRLTEYFLVGSFVSWLVALGGLALLG